MKTKSIWLKILDVVTVILFLAAVGLVFFYAPMERTMGQVQRVFYFHVATAWVGMLGFFVAFITGTLVLMRGKGNLIVLNILTLASVLLPVVAYLVLTEVIKTLDAAKVIMYCGIIGSIILVYLLGLNVGVRLKRTIEYWDIKGVAAIEISLVFFFIAIVSGSIWARPTWNTWWTWDLRLTTATIVELIYAAYMLLRAGIEDPDRRAFIGAVYTILGFVSVPLTFISIRLVQSIHPVLFGNSGGSTESGLDNPKMLFTFIFSLMAFMVIFIDLLWHRIRLGQLADRIEQLRLKISH